MRKRIAGRNFHLFCALAFVLLFGLWLMLGSEDIRAAEEYMETGTSMLGSPQINIGQTYYTTISSRKGYVSFVTPAEGGYVTVYCKNVSIRNENYPALKTGTEEILKDNWGDSAGYAATWEFRSEPGLRNGASLEPNTRYYLEMGNTGDSGNVLFSVSFQADANPDGKEQAEEIALNAEYTRGIDSNSYGLEDHDYFKFTTQKNGGHRLTLSQSETGGGFFNYEVRKWSTDELAKRSNGYDASSYFYSSSTEVDIALEANTTYYLKIWSYGRRTYTFSVNNQSVTGISIPATAALDAGRSFKLNPVISPAGAYNKEVSYSSSNDDIAWVHSDGTVHASSSNYGTTTITVKAKDGSGVTASCLVTVRPMAPSTPYVASYSKKSHIIKWSAQSGVSGYKVYVKSGKKWKALANTHGTAFTRKGLKAGQKCQYRIRSVVGNGQYSGFSGICYAATAPGGKVKKVRVKKHSGRKRSLFGSYYYAKISWGKAKGAAAYNLYYRSGGSSTKSLLKTTKKKTVKASFYRSKGGSKTVYFYVVPVIKYHGTTYSGSQSKGKRYRLH